MTPDGSRFYATWLQIGEEGSDIWFRRIMSPAFPANAAAMTAQRQTSIQGFEISDAATPVGN